MIRVFVCSILCLCVGFFAGAKLRAPGPGQSSQKEVIEKTAIAGARESARIGFERDIGLAERERLAAKTALEDLNASEMQTGLSAADYDVQMEDFSHAVERLKIAIARVEYLRSEAARLGIQVSPPTPNPN